MSNRLVGNALRGIHSNSQEDNRPQSQKRIQDRLGSPPDSGGSGPSHRRRRQHSSELHRPTHRQPMERESDRRKIIHECLVSVPRWTEVDNNIPHLVNWLCHKVKGMRVEVVQASKDPASGDLVVQLKNVREAHAIAKLNGYTYNGQTLKITQRDREYTAGPPPIPAEFLRPNVVQLIAEFVKSRCTPERRMVDLSGVEKQPLMLQTLGRLTTGSWTAILKAVSEIYPQVETISFADNGLRSLTPLNGLAHYLPGVINLSFAQNAITTNTTFRAALGGLASLRELVLIGNPYREEMLEKQRENIYRKQIADLFPSLQYLDTVPIDRTVTDGIKFGGLPDVTTSTAVKAVEPCRLPLSPLGKFFDSEETRQTVFGFLSKYIHLYDTTDRSTLLDAYSANAQFSLSLVSTIPLAVSRQQQNRRPQSAGSSDYQVSESDYSLSKTAPQSKKSDWLKYDRNLSALKDRNSRKQLLFTRPLDIVHTLAHLPATQHKNPETFVIDAWQVPGGTSTTSSSSVSSSRIIPPQLIINVHGELTETRSNTQRYFDRTFILVPSLPGSKSHSSGWPVEIVNDCWTVRPVVDEDAVRRVNNRSRQNMPDVKNLTQQTEMAQLPPVIGKAANLPVVPVSQQLPQQLAQSQQSQSQLTIQQQQYAIELAKLTGLNLEFSVLCLKEHGWQPERALEGFKLARAQNRIPQQAFSTSQ